jgi:hypothetical protein
MTKLGQVIIGIVVLQAGCGTTTTFFDAPFFDAPLDAPLDTLPPDVLVQGTTFKVVLSPAMEVSACASAGTSATGAATIAISADNSTVAVENFTFSGLSGPATAAHIHAGPVGVAGPIIFDLGTNLTLPINRTFTAIDYPAPVPAGAPATFALFVQGIKAGGASLSVDTVACPAGEISRTR